MSDQDFTLLLWDCFDFLFERAFSASLFTEEELAFKYVEMAMEYSKFLGDYLCN